MPPLLEDLALALGALGSFAFVGVAGLRAMRAPLAGLELLAFGVGFGVAIHGLIGLAVAFSPAKQATAWSLFALAWSAAAVVLWRQRSSLGWRDADGVRPALAILALFIAGCVAVTHLPVRFPKPLPDGFFIFKEHTLAAKVQVLASNLPADNHLPFVVEEFLLRDISFSREPYLTPGQVVSNRPILMALATVPFHAAIDPPPRQVGPLPRFHYWDKDWPDVGVFLAGPEFRRFLAPAIVLNALALLGAALVLAAHGPRWLLVPGLLVLATSPFYLSQTIFTWPKSMAAFYVLLALHALARNRHPAWVGAVAALAYWSHPLSAAFLIGFGLHYLFGAVRRQELRALLIYGGTAAALLAPWFVWTRFGLRVPSDMLAQNLVGHGVDSPFAHVWIRIVNLHEALAARMLGVHPFDAEKVFHRAIGCLPGILGLLALPAYAGCAVCWKSHRVWVLHGVLLPVALLSLVFARYAQLTLLCFHSVVICLWLLGLVVVARAPRAVALGLVVAQVALHGGLLWLYGRALTPGPAEDGVFYRLLDHRPEVRDAPAQINFHAAIVVGNEGAETIWSVPPTSLTYRGIALPATGAPRFRCKVAIHPLVWSEGNADGAEFALEVRAGAAPPQRVWSALIDPFGHPEQRAWLPVDVDLSAFAGQTVDLILKNGPGPAGNAYADWCLWADPALAVQ